MEILSNSQLGERTERPVKIVQFGGGNFLRAFVNWMVDILNEKTDFNGAVAIVKPTAGGDYQELKEQDGLFTVLLDGFANGKVVEERRIVKSVQKVVHAYNEWEAYLKLAESSDVRFVVSNTTEAGIKFNAEDRFNEGVPGEFPAKLTKWLHHRFMHFNGDEAKGCYMLPCELIENNGEALKETILSYIDHWNLGADFKNWILKSNYFCSTLVDRIVSGFPKEKAEAIEQELGYKDQLLVSGEYYHSWIIQKDGQIANELPFSKTGLNVQFVDDAAPYRDMKVRILNGAHTAMVPVGYLSGLRLVKDVMSDTEVSTFVEELLMQEVILTLNFSDEERKAYANDILDRFRNPRIEHQLMSIALNSVSKFVARLQATLKDYVALKSEVPPRISLGLAALIRFYKGEWQGETIALKDDAQAISIFIEQWSALSAGSLSYNAFADNILAQKELWQEDLTQVEGLSAQIATYLEKMDKEGIRPIIKEING